ncbi:MAG: aminotransferase class I/II-fold pyridoxal phosphate-dependent enzyme [Gammaproteobacteria bacterium]|nr:aminotransferase class I/II-fold pyridoxal phosphate-dependent enzyme [Gammaproteobacteria bacterium]
MSLLDRLQQFTQQHATMDDDRMAPLGAVIEHLYSATEGSVKGRRTILVGTNNYLGLTFDNQCINANHQATRTYGTGTTGSRLANGSYAGHQDLENELADFYGVSNSIVFSTGYTANLGMISALVSKGDTIMIDEHCHASIYDGCNLSGADIIHFRHNNAEDLDKRLRRLGDKASTTLIIIEGIYSMLGDRGNLKEIVAVKQKYDALLLVDEAHSLGVLGESGRGLSQELEVEEHVDFITGTFSKSLAGIGGYCVSQHSELEVIRYTSRPYIFTASPSPGTIASTRAALEIIRNNPGLRKQLWENANRLYDGLKVMGYDLSPEVSPVIAVNVGERENALAMWKKLFDRGIYVNLVMPPATPNSKCLLRCSVSAAHTRAQLDVVLDAFASFQVPALKEQLA